MSTHIYYYIWTIPIGRQEPAIISVHADSIDDAYASIKAEVEKLSAIVRNPPRYVIDPVATHKLRVVAAVALHTSFDKVSVEVKNTTLPERLMQLLDNVAPVINHVKHYGWRLDREPPTIC
jgi:hypothetical protein